MDLNVPFYKMSDAMKTQVYLDNLTVIFNPQALFSDGTAEYRMPPEPGAYEDVKLRFRSGRENVDEVYLVFADKRYPMEKVANDRLFDYYEHTVCHSQLSPSDNDYPQIPNKLHPHFHAHCENVT